MSISWFVLGGAPGSPSLLLATTSRLLHRATGLDGWQVTARGKLAGRQWSSQPPSDVPPVVAFDLELTASAGGWTGTVWIDSDQELEDDGSPVPGRVAVEVMAARTTVSVLTGLTAGLAVWTASGGELGGVGLGARWYRASELDRVLAVLDTGADESAPEARLKRWARHLGTEHLHLT